MTIKLGQRDSSLKMGPSYGDYSWKNFLRVSSDIGFEGVELSTGGNLLSETILGNKEGRTKLVEESKKHGVEIVSLSLDILWKYSFASSKESVVEKAEKITKEAAGIAAEVGAKNILIPVTPSKNEKIEKKQARERWIRGIKACSHRAEKNGVFYGLENVGQPFARTAKQLLTMLQEIDSPAVKVYYDPGNTVRRILKGLDLSPLENIKRLSDQICQVHMKDPNSPLLGRGEMNIPTVIEALKNVNYQAWIVLETGETENVREKAKKNLEFLKDILGYSKRSSAVMRDDDF